MSTLQPTKMRKDSIGYRHNNHSVGLATVHLVWIPKRRKPVLKGDIKLRLSEILDSVASDKEWIIKAKEIASDHVHLLVEYDDKSPICEVTAVPSVKRYSNNNEQTSFLGVKVA